MAGIPSSLTRKDLEFMVDDIGDDMIAIMTPEKILGGMNREKKHGLVSLMLKTALPMLVSQNY